MLNGAATGALLPWRNARAPRDTEAPNVKHVDASQRAPLSLLSMPRARR